MFTPEQALVVNDPPQERRVEEARARLVLARQRTQVTLSALRAEISEKVEWRTWVRARPVTFLAAAFVAGLLLARRR